MSDADALLNAIIANPDEDTPRLAYADWLDEHADGLPDPGAARAHAEFIRVQIEVTRLERLSPVERERHAAVFNRNQELTQRHREEALGRLGLLGPHSPLDDGALCEFRRGFLARVESPAADFLAHADALAAIRPLPHISVTGVASRLTEFVRCPRLDIVSGLSVYPPYGAPAQPDLPTQDEIRDGAARLTRLASLDVDSCGVGDWFCALLGNFTLPALQELNLSNNAVTDVGVLDLLYTAHPRKLRRLALGGNPIGDAGAVGLATSWPSGADDRLERLDLTGTQIGPDGAAALRQRFGARVEV